MAWKAKRRWMDLHKIVNSTPDTSEAHETDGNDSGNNESLEEEEALQSSAV
jgi:hypothetical protein